MERNDNLGAPGSETGTGGQAEANEFSGSGSSQQQGGGTSGFDFSSPSASEAQGLKARAKNVLGTANEKLADVGSGVRDKVGTAKDKLAGALEAGADRLRERSQVSTGDGGAGAAYAGAPGATTTSLPADGKLAHVSDRVAGGMQATADWLRDADLDNLKTGIERQVKEHPGRTLLIAAGLGYLVARAFRGDK